MEKTADPRGAPENIRFVLNAHGQGFEVYSLLCIKSIRRVCGKNALIRVYQPDNLPPVSPLAERFYERNNVELVAFHNDFLPQRLTDLRDVPARHLTLNKVYCLQDLRTDERRLLLDADVLLLADPRPLLHLIDEPVACPLVDTPEAFGGDWDLLYRELEVPCPKQRVRVWETYAYGNAPEPPKVETVPYFSSGVVYVDGRSKLPKTWLEVCRQLESRISLVPRSFFLDQVALTVAAHKTEERYALLPKAMNCTYEVWRYTPDVQIFHYVGFDTLSAAVARFPEVRAACKDIVPRLAREDGLDLRFQLLTQWPRWFRRCLGILSGYSERILGKSPIARNERT